MSTNTHIVKIKRTGYESVLMRGTAQECRSMASKLNANFQTDEYVVDVYDPARAMEFGKRLATQEA